MFGLTLSGKLVLIECKLWRNPQARREVVAQALEYAALMRAWSYADLTARLKSKLDNQSQNPLYDLAKEHDATLNEAKFVDQVTRSLNNGDFILIIAGDGIRSDVQAMSEHLNQSGNAAIFSLLEMQLWQADDGALTILPSIPVKTKVIKQRVIVSEHGTPLNLDTPETEKTQTEAIVDPERAAQRSTARAFWQRFIDEVQFDHAEQPAPRHGGHNFVRLALPEPMDPLTAYRTVKGSAGFFCDVVEEEGQGLIADLKASIEGMSAEVGATLVLDENKRDPHKVSLSVSYERQTSDDEAILMWFKVTANKLTSSLRTFLAQY